jgi:hypothetical protein
MLHKKDLYPPLPRPIRAHVHDEELETILQRTHIRVSVLSKLKPIRNDLDRPSAELSMLSSLEAEIKVARILWVYAERIHATFGIGLGVGCEPLFL